MKQVFDDDDFVQSWIFCDFPYGPENQTALDYFEIFLKNRDLSKIINIL